MNHVAESRYDSACWGGRGGGIADHLLLEIPLQTVVKSAAALI